LTITFLIIQEPQSKEDFSFSSPLQNMLSTEERPSLYGSAVPMDYSGMRSMKQINGALQPNTTSSYLIITGPAGCGKTTVAQHLAKELSIPYIEGDDVRTDPSPHLSDHTTQPLC
jgi:Mrp family chromosome partitioning ATPase